MSSDTTNYLAEQPSRLSQWFKGTLRPDQVSPLDLLIVQGTRFCNLDCSYCYLPFRASKGRIDLDMLERAFTKFMAAGLIPPKLSLAWHAGEPLVLPVEFYEDAFARIARIVGPEVEVEHHFQTNATLLTDQICKFVKRHDVQIGVSLDGPQHLHDSRRRQRNGSGSFEATMRGVEMLRSHGIKHSAICVLTSESLKQPDAIYEFFRDIGCRNLGFNVEEVEGANKTTSLSAQSVAQYKAFLRHLLNRVRAEHNIMQIREIALTQNLVHYSMAGIATRSSEADPFCNVGLDIDGNLYTFSPELLDIKGPDGEGFSLGHIDEIDFATLMDSRRYRAVAEPIAAGLELCRQTCSYFDTCGGAAPVNRLSENGTFISTETLHCRMTRQAIIDLVEEDFRDRVNARIARRETSPVEQTRAASAKSGRPRPPVAPQMSADPLALGLPLPGATALGEQLELSPGTIPARSVPGLVVQHGALQPRDEWRRLTDAELRKVEGEPNPARPYDYLAIVELPEPLRSRFDAFATSSAKPVSSSSELDELAAQLARAFGDYSGRHVALGFERRSGGRPIATQQAGTGELIGLHVDSWTARAASDRHDAGNRICINLGDEDRRLLVVNAPIGRVAATMKQLEELNVDQVNPTDIGRRFLARFPNFPVLRLTIRPGQAYIAPTELIIHDGDTAGSRSDCFTTVLGRFPFTGAQSHLARDAGAGAPLEPVRL